MPMLIHIEQGSIINLEAVNTATRVKVLKGWVTRLTFGAETVNVTGAVGEEVWAILMGSVGLVGPDARKEREEFEAKMDSKLIVPPDNRRISP